MANTFKNYFSKNVGTLPATVFTGASATQSTVIGLTVSNTTTSAITADVYITSGGTDYYIVKNASIPVGASLVAVGGDQKLVVETADVVKVVSSAATSADVILSVLEIS